MENERFLQEWIVNDLKRSGLSDETIQEMKIRSVKNADDLKAIVGFDHKDGHPVMQATQAYLIPYLYAEDTRMFGRVRLETVFQGMKYLSPITGHTDSTKHLYILEGEKEKVGKNKHPLVIVEGEKKTAKVAQELRKYMPDYTAVGIGGVTMWADCPEWREIPLSCRKVLILCDSDWKSKPDVQIQMVKIYLWARKKKANVGIVCFDKGKGIDDHLVECERLEMNIFHEMERLFGQSTIDPAIWNTNLNHYKMAEILAECYYSKDIDGKALWDEQNFAKAYGIKWNVFREEIAKGYHDIIKREASESENTIKVEGGEIHKIVERMDSIIVPTKKIFQRNGMLVRVAKYLKKPGEEDVKIENVDAQYIIRIFTEKVKWLKSRNDEWERVDCPKSYAENYLSGGPWKLPVLMGIINAPTLREDGSILQTPGYDEQTGLFFYPNGQFPPIPENPTKEDAMKALEKLKSVFEEFIFEKEIDRSVVLASVLTASVRKSLQSSPLFIMNSHKQASGKSLLASVVSLIVIGCHPKMIITSKSSIEEDKKQTFDALLEGNQIISFDNMEKPITGEYLCNWITEEEATSRILGISKNYSVSSRVTFFATGNNVVVAGDMSTRTLLCTIDQQCEKPEETDFKRKKLEKYVLENRGELLQSALTILRAFKVAGNPVHPKSYRLFIEWNDWIRASLIWLGMDDPCKTREKIEENDPVREKIKLLLNNWYNVTKDEITIRQLIGLSMMPGEKNEILKVVLMEVAKGKENEINDKKLSYFIRGIKGRWEGGKKLEDCGKDRIGFAKWKVIEKQN